MRFKLKIDTDALNDIQETFDWYELRLKGLGLRYKNQAKKQINSLKKAPYIFSIKHNEIRCRKIEKFLFLIHYLIYQKTNMVSVFAVFHTSRNPEIWNTRPK